MNEDDEIAEEAVYWWMHITERQENYDRAFWQWLTSSATHLKVYMEVMEVARRLKSLS